MTILSFYGHSYTKWPQNEWDDAEMTIFSLCNDGKWLEWGWNDEVFKVRQMPQIFFSIILLSFLPYFIIWQSFIVWNDYGMVFNHSTLIFILLWCHPIILVSFHHSEIISMPYIHFVVIPLFHTPSHVIPSFWYHSSHSIFIPLSFKTFYNHSVIPTSFAIILWSLHTPAPKFRHFSCNQPLG